MKIAVGLIQRAEAFDVELGGAFFDAAGKTYPAGRYHFTTEIALTPSGAACSFAIENVTIGIGFHWERNERQVFRGGMRIIQREGLTIINDVDLEDYVTSVISSEMSASCPAELLKAHAVISRSWLLAPQAGEPSAEGGGREIIRWYGREAHLDFDVCADDHCQRYQGITKAFSAAVSGAVEATAGQFLLYKGFICDARFSKCCGGITEDYRAAWDDREVPYLISFYDGPGRRPPSAGAQAWIRSSPPAYCNTNDSMLLAQILPGFDQETRDFYRWKVAYAPGELAGIIKSKTGLDLGPISNIEPLERGNSGRIVRLKISGAKDSVVIGKELEIRRALSQSHLYSSAFVVDREADRFILRGAGWGHGVGLCQIGAAVMASQGKKYGEILLHYYPNTSIGVP